MKLLIVGYLQGHISTAGKLASDKGAKVAHIESIDGAIEALRSGQGADLVMCDVELEIGRLITSLKSEHINVPIVACGIDSNPDAAVRAIRAGAKEYVPLPPDSELIAAVLQAVAEEDSTFIAKDPIMKPVIKLADRVSKSDASILITGESGTGKEVMAHYIHGKSKRNNAQFVSVNCAAIPENLLESELFGHEKGAFTGAIARRIGKFEEANGGTLLLDEISEMDLKLQAKILRAIQEREIDRVGGSSPVKVNIRLIATSNRNLEEEVKEKRFREDLYYRLNVVSIHMPSLCDRPEDLKPLAEHFAKKYAAANGVDNKKIANDAMEKLKLNKWRGNVRELENTMHRAVLMADNDEIDASAIIITGQQNAEQSDRPLTNISTTSTEQSTKNEGSIGTLVGQTVAQVERHLIIDTLQHCLGNRTHAANILGISIRTLRNKLKQYNESGVSVPPPSSGDQEQQPST